MRRLTGAGQAIKTMHFDQCTLLVRFVGESVEQIRMGTMTRLLVPTEQIHNLLKRQSLDPA